MQEVKELKIAKKWEHMDILILFLASRFFFIVMMLASGRTFSDILGFFDAEHYIAIAKTGYTEKITTFFPVIPMIIRFTTQAGLLVINNICFAFSLYILKKLNCNKLIMATFALSPMGFFSMLVYTESVFFFLSILAFYMFINNKNPLLMGVVIGLSVMTRSVGSMLFFAIFIGMCVQWFRHNIKLSRIIITYVPATILALVYPVYLQFAFGNWKLFMDSQFTDWYRESSNIFKTYFVSLKMLFTNSYTFRPDGYILVERINEALSTILLTVLLIFVVRCIIRMIQARSINVEELVMAIYVLLSAIAINGTIRNPNLDAPTDSFYRYYYTMFPLYLMLRRCKPVTTKVALGFTVSVSFLISFVYCINVFFY